LSGTRHWFLHFNKFHPLLGEFCDANWISDNEEVSSTSCYVFALDGGAILCAKQNCIARSTMKAEFFALELAG